MRLNATNHIGWEVQQFLGKLGWMNALRKDGKPHVFDSKEEAEAILPKLPPLGEYRVYESIKEK